MDYCADVKAHFKCKLYHPEEVKSIHTVEHLYGANFYIACTYIEPQIDIRIMYSVYITFITRESLIVRDNIMDLEYSAIKVMDCIKACTKYRETLLLNQLIRSLSNIVPYWCL